MKKIIFGLAIVLVLGAAGYFFLQPGTRVQANAAPTPLPAVQSGGRVVAQARVLPVNYAELSLVGGGIITDVPVKPGDAVKAGQVLLRLDSARQQAAVSQAQAGLKVAQAQLARVKAGATEAELAVAQAQLNVAQAEYARMAQGAKQESVAAAQAAMSSAQANYAAATKAAGAGSSQITAAKSAVDKAKAAVDRAQAAFDRAGGPSAPYAGMLPESLALQSATIDYEQALAAYDAVTKTAGPDAQAKIQAAAASVAQAQAALATVNPTPEDLAAVKAKVDQAQANLAQLKAGARAEDIAVAQSQVDQAAAAVEAAQAAARDLELRAPFDGTVAWVDATVGESINPGATVVRLAELSAWQIVTEDLTEASLGQVQPGTSATLKFDAIPNLVLPGAIERVELVGEKKQGDITYTVVVRPAQNDNRLRWNMTASVEIKAEK